jgi:hypothetical protein
MYWWYLSWQKAKLFNPCYQKSEVFFWNHESRIFQGSGHSSCFFLLKVVRSTMQEELQAAQTKTTLWDLFRNTNMRKRICLLFVVRYVLYNT